MNANHDEKESFFQTLSDCFATSTPSFPPLGCARLRGTYSEQNMDNSLFFKDTKASNVGRHMAMLPCVDCQLVRTRMWFFRRLLCSDWLAMRCDQRDRQLKRWIHGSHTLSMTSSVSAVVFLRVPHCTFLILFFSLFLVVGARRSAATCGVVSLCCSCT